MATRAPRAPLLAYVLHRYDWSETSLILDLFTREQGRLAVAAKGAKRPYSQLRSVLLPFQRLQVSVSGSAAKDESGGSGEGGSGDIQNLRGAEWAGGAAMLTGAALFSGFYLNELLMKLLARHDPHARLFDAYAVTLAELADGRDESRVEAALRAFELTLLSQTGLLPDLSVVTQTQVAVQLPARYGLVPEAGVVPAAELPAGGGPAGTIVGESLIQIEAALLHGSLPALQQACTRALPELKGALRSLIQHQLGNGVLRTRKVMIDVQNLVP